MDDVTRLRALLRRALEELGNKPADLVAAIRTELDDEGAAARQEANAEAKRRRDALPGKPPRDSGHR
jgi:hypothetical protein